MQFYFIMSLIIFVICSRVFISILPINSFQSISYFFLFNCFPLLLTERNYLYIKKKFLCPWYKLQPPPISICLLTLLKWCFVLFAYTCRNFFLCFLMLSFTIWVLSCWLQRTSPLQVYKWVLSRCQKRKIGFSHFPSIFKTLLLNVNLFFHLELLRILRVKYEFSCVFPDVLY